MTDADDDNPYAPSCVPAMRSRQLARRATLWLAIPLTVLAAVIAFSCSFYLIGGIFFNMAYRASPLIVALATLGFYLGGFGGVRMPLFESAISLGDFFASPRKNRWPPKKQARPKSLKSCCHR